MLALTPVTVKSTKSMMAMQRLQPEMKKLQAKYKGPENREMLNQEMMKLYKENGTSPFGACLPSLLQMPFLIVLYSLIRGLSYVVPKGQTYTNAAGATIKCHGKGWMRLASIYSDDSSMHQALVASMAKCTGGSGWICRRCRSRIMPTRECEPGGIVIPYLVLIGAAMFLQYYQMKQMNSRNPQAAAANPQMQTMQKFFPIIFGVIYLRVPAGATIYMVVSSAMRIGTQEVMFRTGMVTPVAAEREIGSAKEQGEGETAPPAAKKTSTATDGTAAAKATLPPAKSDSKGTNGAKTNGPGSRQREEAGGGQATRTAWRASDEGDRGCTRTQSAPAVRARSGQERLDSAWSGLKWRERPSKKRPSRRWTSSALPSVTPR